MCEDLASLQMVLDTCWMVTRAIGMKVMIKGAKKTAWQATYWNSAGEECDVEGFEMRLPDGRLVPQIVGGGKYRYLGSDEMCTWEGAQTSVRELVAGECAKLLKAAGGIDTLSMEHTRNMMNVIVDGMMGYYGRATAMDWETCERIESARAEALQRRGAMAASTARAQVHASGGAGGMGHRHAYQAATAALCDQFERVLSQREETPASVALWAHVRNTYLRLGWTGRGKLLEWHPTHLRDALSEDMIVEGWLKMRLRAQQRIVQEEGVENDPTFEEESRAGPPVWEAAVDDGLRMRQEDARRDGAAKDGAGGGRCRVRVGTTQNGRVSLHVAAATAGCTFTSLSRRLAACGVRTWADITKADASAEPAARWMTWREAAARYPGLQGTQDKEAYEQLMSELGAEEWRRAREEWFARVARGEWRGERAEAVADGQTWTWERTVAARRTATCFGGTEYLVRWGGEWDDTWVKEVYMANAKTAAVQHEMREAVAKRWRAVSLFEHAVGKEAVDARDTPAHARSAGTDILPPLLVWL